MKNHRIIDITTKQSSKGLFEFGNTLKLKAVSSISVYRKLLQRYPNIANSALLRSTRTPHSFNHTILTKERLSPNSFRSRVNTEKCCYCAF